MEGKISNDISSESNVFAKDVKRIMKFRFLDVFGVFVNMRSNGGKVSDEVSFECTHSIRSQKLCVLLVRVSSKVVLSYF